MASKSSKATSPVVAKKASAVLKSSSTGKASKSAAGSALSQVSSGKETTKKVATDASKVLRDGRTGAASKAAAGSTLAQTPKKGTGTNSGGPRKK